MVVDAAVVVDAVVVVGGVVVVGDVVVLPVDVALSVDVVAVEAVPPTGVNVSVGASDATPCRVPSAIARVPEVSSSNATAPSPLIGTSNVYALLATTGPLEPSNAPGAGAFVERMSLSVQSAPVARTSKPTP